MSPPAGWKSPFFFTKNLHNVQIFCEKQKSTMLPQAKPAFRLAPVRNRLHRVSREKWMAMVDELFMV